MKFAHFSHVWNKPGMSPHQRYEELWRELALCDDLGYDFAFCVEHHFQPHESWMSAPALYAVGGGARTRRLLEGDRDHLARYSDPYIDLLVRYLCDVQEEEDGASADEDPMVEVEVFLMLEETTPDFVELPAVPKSLYAAPCP